MKDWTYFSQATSLRKILMLKLHFPERQIRSKYILLENLPSSAKYLYFHEISEICFHSVSWHSITSKWGGRRWTHPPSGDRICIQFHTISTAWNEDQLEDLLLWSTSISSIPIPGQLRWSLSSQCCEQFKSGADGPGLTAHCSTREDIQWFFEDPASQLIGTSNV